MDKSLSGQQIKCTPTNTFYPLDGDLSSGWSYQALEQLGPGDCLGKYRKRLKW